jgi:hypothetical protein
MGKDLTINLGKDNSGVFSKAVEALGNAGINLDGGCEVSGIAHFLVKDAAQGRKALEGAGFTVSGEEDVILTNVPDRPGELAKITKQIANAGVNLNFFYLATDTRAVLGVSDLAKAKEALVAVGARA